MAKRIDYKTLSKNIPHAITVGSKINYEVLYSDTIKGPDVLGETRPTDKQVILKNGQSSRELTLTYWHEFLHAIAEEHDVTLTESEVRKLEKASLLL